ncbi:protein of unknown function (DUF4787) [Fragilaria crotonensis]|nr:protein of unknown function (DUF4787) [Fragilaria crotonensis]
MAVVATPIRSHISAPSNSWMLFLVKALLIAIIILLLPRLVDGSTSSSNKRVERELRTMRQDCSETTDRQLLLVEERTNCIHRCISNPCFERVYGTQPLEDGEIDIGRRRGFDSCVRDELRRNKQKRQLDGAAKAKRRRTAHGV